MTIKNKLYLFPNVFVISVHWNNYIILQVKTMTSAQKVEHSEDGRKTESELFFF